MKYQHRRTGKIVTVVEETDTGQIVYRFGETKDSGSVDHVMQRKSFFQTYEVVK